MHRFNSQRDGILPNAWYWFKFWLISFNSQRDGILRFRPKLALFYKTKFQFPTGWNSTELYAAAIETFLEFQFPTGWNSTKVRKGIPRFQRVSIPNGMEFYCSRYARCLRFDDVSIPNGMEFYWYAKCSLWWSARVSIPNGMEFYSTNFAIFLGRKC